MRIARGLLTFVFALVAAAAVGLAFALLLALHGQNLPLLRAAVGAVGTAVAGQRTEALALRVELRPLARTLSGEARLTVRAEGGDRGRLLFLLNDGLALIAVWREGADGARAPLRSLRLGPLVVVELPTPLAAGEAAEIALAYDGTPRRSALTDAGSVIEADEVTLAPADFWYPTDVQGAFDATVEVLLPAALTLAHNGRETSHTREGTSARIRFAAERPVGGLALIAGRYQPHALERDGHHYRALLPDDSTLDGARLVAQMATARHGLATHYGPSGFTQSTLVVPRRVTRAFNDGSGLLAVPPRYFRDGRYGYEILAHELAHDWWGATVSERWLTPGSGGEWLVEGFAEFSAWRAVGEHFGEAALVSALRRGFFDPDRAGVLAEMSVIDNGLDPNARATIYDKGGYVTYMLAEQLGGETFDAAARAFLERYRYRPAGDAELQAVFGETAQQDLEPFFATWVRSRAALDLALEPQDGNAAVRTLRDAPPPAALALWRFAPDGAIAREETAVGASPPLAAARRVVLDPLAATADMIRANNVLPRGDPPQRVAASARGELLIVAGEPVGWEPATLRVVDAAGQALHTWVLDRGLAGEPQWSADGTRVLALESGREGEPTLIALNLGDGSRRPLGHDTIAAADGDGTVVARGGRLIRLAGGTRRVLIEHAGGRIVAPQMAPQGGAIAYAVLRGAEMELRLLDPDAAEARVLFTWPASPLRWRWAPDGSRLYAVVGGDWDWQLWELPRDAEPRRLVHEAARIVDLAVAADSRRVALVAQAELDEPNDRAEVFIIDGSDFRRYDLAGRGALSATWLDADALLVVTREVTDPSIPRAPALHRLRLSDGSLEPFG